MCNLSLLKIDKTQILGQLFTFLCLFNVEIISLGN